MLAICARLKIRHNPESSCFFLFKAPASHFPQLVGVTRQVDCSRVACRARFVPVLEVTELISEGKCSYPISGAANLFG